jgi:two-component system, response regulator PdtaR
MLHQTSDNGTPPDALQQALDLITRGKREYHRSRGVDMKPTTATKILVVEDEIIVALHTKQFLQKLGYTVPTIAFSGREAVQAALAFRPDLILMDIHLRGQMTGIEATHEIQAKLDIPVIYITAFVDQETRALAQATNPVAFVKKPFSESHLAEIIEQALGRQAPAD